MVPGLITVVGHAVAFYFLSLPCGQFRLVSLTRYGRRLESFDLSGRLDFQGQKLDGPAILGMAMIIGGVVVMNLFSQSAPH